MQFINSICIEAPSTEVWKALADIEKVSLWADPIVEAHCSESKNSGIGAERVCQLKGNMTVRETWTEWDEGRSFTYVGDGIPFTTSAKNSWSIREMNGNTLLTSVAEIEFRRGLLGALMQGIMKYSMKRQGPQVMASFKYWVENGRPYTGKPSALIPGPVIC